jgi:hypothetical protein
MLDVMLDLETLGRKPGCVILEIGAVRFGPTGVDRENAFHSVISTSSCVAAGLNVDPETKAWWSKQSSKAQRLLSEALQTPPDKDLRYVLGAFTGWLGKGARIWGCGASFDEPILGEAYDRLGLSRPWRFSDCRCFRTLRELLPTTAAVQAPAHVGTTHRALDDAEWQAEYAVRILRHLRRIW